MLKNAKQPLIFIVIFINIVIVMVAANSMITHYEDVNTEETFITQQEYGKQLYNNPRGISCKSCHGEFGKGQQLAQYKHKGKLQEIYAPDITELDISRFKKKLYSNRGVMPKYYLTDSEIEAIYEYITQK